jgi:hypothetical protein
MKNMLDVHFIRKGNREGKKNFTKYETSISIRIIARVRHIQRNSQNALRKMSVKSEMLLNKINMVIHEPTRHNPVIRIERIM